MADYVVTGPSEHGPGEKHRFHTRRAAFAFATELSKHADGYVDVMRNGITIGDCIRGKCSNPGRKKWIQKALGTKRRRVDLGPHHRKAVRVVSAHKGALHRQLGVPVGEKIPVAKLRTAAKKGGTLGRRARLALTLRKLSRKRRGK